LVLIGDLFTELGRRPLKKAHRREGGM
jgi:hypothetical protein